MANQVTYEDVAQAAEQLLTEGRPVGPTKVREVLGRGSFSTVQKYLAEWENVQAQAKARAEEEKRIGPPDELTAEMQKIIAAYWPHAVARAREQMQPELQALQAQLSEATGRNKEAMVEMANLENRLEAASAKAARMEDAEKRAGEANLKIIALQTDLSRLEKIETRFEDQKQLIQTLQDQGKALTDQNAAANKRAESVSAELAAAREKAEKLAAETAQKIASLQAEASRLEKAEARSEAQIKSLQEHNAALTRKAEALASDLQAAGIKIAKLEAKLEMAFKK